MRLNFRQGIVSHQTSSGVQNFLDVSPSGNVSLLANNRPVRLTIAQGNSNYTYTEDFTVVDAWVGPFASSVNYWLYWDFNPLTFERTFGYTLLEPVAQDAEPGNGNAEVISVIPGSAPGVGAFIVSGYYQFVPGYNFAIIGSDDNDGNYTVVQASYNDLLNQTTITVNENVNPFAGTEYGEATFDIDFYGEPLLQTGRHWYDTATHRHYVWVGTAWKEVIRIFATRYRAPSQFSPQTINFGSYLGTQIGDTSSILSGRVVFDEASNTIRRDNGTFFTTEDQFFANSSSVDAIRLESNVTRAQLIDPAAAAFSIVAWKEDGRVGAADYEDTGSTIVGVLMESLLVDEVGSILIQGTVTNPDWNWTTGPSAVPVGTPLWIESGELVPYDPHSFSGRASTPVMGIQNGSSGQYFEVVGAYTLSKGSLVSIVESTANNNGSYTVVSSEFNVATTTTKVFVDEIIIDPIISGNMLLTVGNYTYAQTPAARVLDKDTIIFEQGLGGVGERGPAGSVENIPVATTSENGSVFLNLPATDPEIPIVVGDNDPRLSDARIPLSHQHSALDITVTPAFSISSLNAQGALEELSVEKLNLNGGTMTGFLTLNSDPTAALHAATKSYVDSLVSGLIWIQPVDYIDIVADNLTTAPVAPEDSDMYIVGTPGGAGTAFPAGWGTRTAGDVVRWDEGAGEWVFIDHISNFAANTRFGATILSGATASGTFIDQHIFELSDPGTPGIYDSTWIPGPEMPPMLNHAFFVKNADSFHAFNQFVYDGSVWIKFGGASTLTPDNITTEQNGNVLSVKQFNDGGVVDVQFWQGLEPSDLATVYSPLGHIHSADAITFSPYASSIPGLGSITSTDTQAAVEEAYDIKANLQPNYATFGDLPDATTYTGMTAYVIDETSHYVSQGGAWVKMGVYPLQLPYDLSYFISGQMLFTDTPVGSFLSTRQIELYSGLPGAFARAKVAPLVDVTYSIVMDDGATASQVGTILFPASNRDGAFTFAAPLTLVAGQSLDIVTPSILEPNIQDVAITIPGCAGAPFCEPPPPPPGGGVSTPDCTAPHLLDDTFWSSSSGTVWNGTYWTSNGDPNWGLDAIGTWAAGFRPTNMEIKIYKDSAGINFDSWALFVFDTDSNIIGSTTFDGLPLDTVVTVNVPLTMTTFDIDRLAGDIYMYNNGGQIRCILFT